jgi:sugar phosphate isomerase/epimerase
VTERPGEPTFSAVRTALRARDRVWGAWLRDVPVPPGLEGGPELVRRAIEVVAEAGGGLLVLPGLAAASPGLDRAELTATGAQARDRGIRLQASLPSVHPDRAAAYTDPAAEPGIGALLEAARLLGVSALHVTFGTEDDRFRPDPVWADQLARGVSVLAGLLDRAPVPVVLKTHEEMTTTELLWLHSQLGEPPGLRVGLSPVNVVARLEDPLLAAKRVAPLVHTVFLDDCASSWTADGSQRRNQRLGEGDIPWAELLAVVDAATEQPAPLVLDVHRAELAMPFFAPDWWAHHPDAAAGELAAVARQTRVRDPEQPSVADRQAHGFRFLAAAGHRGG